MFTEKDAKDALIKLASIKGVQKAITIEQMMRCETAHFTSWQYKNTGTGGMEAGKWPNLAPSKINGTITMPDNHPDKVKVKNRIFIVWKSVEDFVFYLSDYIDRHEKDGGFARWNSTDLNQQAKYMSAVKGVKSRFFA